MVYPKLMTIPFNTTKAEILTTIKGKELVQYRPPMKGNTVDLPVDRPRSCRVIYYFDTPVLGIRHQLFDHVKFLAPLLGRNVFMNRPMLNPNMKEVVRNEVINLLHNGIIYSISDNKWDNVFEWTEHCEKAFVKLKNFLTSAPVIEPPDWSLPFKIMCDASDYVVGAVFEQRKDKKPYVIYYTKFDITIKDKKGTENVVADHLSRLTIDSTFDITQINDYFPDESLLSIFIIPWFANIINFLATGDLPAHWSTQDKRKFLNDVKNFYWDDPYLFKYCLDQIFRRCIPDNEISSAIKFCHSEAFIVDYVSKWIEAIPSRNNDHKIVIKFLKENILSRFGIPRAMISDGGTHFCNKPFKSLIKKYEITHKVTTLYHPQTSGQKAKIKMERSIHVYPYEAFDIENPKNDNVLKSFSNSDQIADNGGSQVLDIISKALAKVDIIRKTVGEELQVSTMSKRINAMFDHADAFIALPGGLSTLKEIFHISS
ncbi:uncharacterized protein LOC112324549 [Populus trichocarpa]|nr:uncharacterized protein LOC112324549 [Populus trichocarpa]|eukprot:XP_024443775.1 uncharacterized protein LOC112324549 [Populus trichocarpa]